MHACAGFYYFVLYIELRHLMSLLLDIHVAVYASTDIVRTLRRQQVASYLFLAIPPAESLLQSLLDRRDIGYKFFFRNSPEYYIDYIYHYIFIVIYLLLSAWLITVFEPF